MRSSFVNIITVSSLTNPVMHMEHKAEIRCMWIMPASLELWTGRPGKWQGSVFVSVLGASQYTYAEATRSQGKETLYSRLKMRFIIMRVLRRLYQITSGQLLLKAIVMSQLWMRHFWILLNIIIRPLLPARAYKPRDKSLVEGAIKYYIQGYTHYCKKYYYSCKSWMQRSGSSWDS